MYDNAYLDSLDERMILARRVLRLGDPASFLTEACDLDNFNDNLLFGYVRSFVRLGYLGDVREVASELGMSRQSIKLHVIELENLLEAQLFERVGASSKLTKMGTLWLPRATEFLEIAGAFLRRKGPNHAHYQSTQLPLRMLLSDDDNSNLLRQFAMGWMQEGQSTESNFFSKYHECCIIYERRSGAWVSKSIGTKAAFSQWFGVEIAKESEGKPLADMRTGSDLQDEIAFQLDRVYTNGGLHFTEVACNLHGPDGGERVPLLYQRLLAELTDEFGHPVIASIIEIIGHHQRDQAPA